MKILKHWIVRSILMAFFVSLWPTLGFGDSAGHIVSCKSPPNVDSSLTVDLYQDEKGHGDLSIKVNGEYLYDADHGEYTQYPSSTIAFTGGKYMFIVIADEGYILGHGADAKISNESLICSFLTSP